jgi:hypothetical protein
MILGSTPPLTEMSTKDLPGGKGRPAREADDLTAICEADCLDNVGASTSHNPMGLHCLLQEQLYLYLYHVVNFLYSRHFLSGRPIILFELKVRLGLGLYHIDND